MTTENALPTYADVEASARRIEGITHRTPVLTSRFADETFGATLVFKAEHLQRMGAFKFRGALNALSQYSSEQHRAGVVTFSSGNHAQAIALAAQELGIPSVIIMPKDAPQMKVNATRGYGGEVVLYDRYNEDREAIGREIAESKGMTLIPPYDHPDIIAGQGTAAKELIEEVGELDALLTPLGGGGLLSGSALAAKILNPEIELYGVEPEAGNDGQRSFRSGEIVHIEPPKTIADGAQTLHLGEITFPIIRRDVADVLTASDEQLVEAMRFFASRMKQIVEPTGCLGLAGFTAARERLAGKRVGIIISGGNIDLARFCALTGGV